MSSSSLSVDDVVRDFRDIHAAELTTVHQLKLLSNDPIPSTTEGVMFCSYSCITDKAHSRRDQLLAWCGDHFDGVVVFDDSHRAKNPTEAQKEVIQLQSSLPEARIIYSSAMAASLAKEMYYMPRLGLWGAKTPFTSNVF